MAYDYTVNWTGGIEAPTRAKEYLLDDLQRMAGGGLGYSQAQRQQMAGAAQQAAAGQIGTQQKQLRRGGMAGPGTFSGYEAEASRQMAGGAAEVGARAALQADVQSNQLAMQQAAEIRGRLERQQERAEDDARYWTQFALNMNESMASIGGMFAESMGSDIRLKENIDPVGVSPSGIRIYEFSYIGQPDRFRGVMAQDLIHTHPEALYVDNNGHYLVNYRHLDVDFTAVPSLGGSDGE